ncbi:hypothetical protein QE197_22315 (plasmid) [Arsenophonus nasoniae]|uniref:Uncharacterized protein n=1 Tax=Arsenophonus nasoniae TaxID=638 RepID=D2TXV2_9GAMM|nr:hypothetical protein [Arsenophonus nasoniae]QBY46541.1 hypothetical protein ArsFIN_51520 [Arsenophonus nasoniae]WGM08312.1 hypothetical protein QE258_23780 [Arsenophonus nasoniae]WGM13310.1 hypothetical protein QE197_22315 [Arsenophonus nasoniae]WGM17903.1 hypothetical protein QE193_21845 [Arsenophonus nasoniae]CBA72227.1 hypothetical protein ARN_09420 [Arsenophonus nasoniae]
MWVLIFTMFSTPYSTNNFASIHTPEFKTEQGCQLAAKEFRNNFENESLNYLKPVAK